MGLEVRMRELICILWLGPVIVGGLQILFEGFGQFLAANGFIAMP
jgi:hypothetical protein